MWKRIGLFAAVHALWAWSLAGGLLAQETAPSRCRSGSLWTQIDWVRLEITGGRLSFTSTRCGQIRLEAEPQAGGRSRQSLSVQMQPGALLATYELLDERMHLTLELDERKQVVLSCRGQAPDSAAEVRYVQPAAGDVTLLVGSQQPRKYVAANLWQLLLAEPAVAREHLLPVLSQLRPNWRIQEQLAQIEAALLDQAGDDVLQQRRQWQAAVERLADPSFARRNEADRALRSAGQSVLGFLRQLDPNGLDPEQRQRIRAVVAASAESGPDSPERVAAWLIADKQVWLALLDQGDLNQRTAAAEHLTRLCGRSIALDPHATPAEQQAQVTLLRAKLAEN